MKKLLALLPVAFLFACNRTPKTPDSETVVQTSVAPVQDIHSFAEPAQAVVKHLDLTLNVSFEKQEISGKAVWTIENLGNSPEIVFDTRQLTIENVTLGDGETETMFALGDEEKFLGKPLSVQIEPKTTRVTIYYKTTKDAAALQWLNPQQTAGKKQPFLFTQSEAILARTWIPCQDSPGIRFTYNATVTVPKNLLALMSAENPQQKNATGVYMFKQKNPIPSYLMALAVGDIAFKAVDGRTGVYAEPVTLQKAAWEFADMGKMVTAAEKLYGPYRWDRYDLIVLPPSFPFGGMENPMLTFATPTVLAGDRSLVSLVAHELAHSWSGNLVTNATWNDFWLNEGFTTYFERRIVEAIYGKDAKEMQEELGFQEFKSGVKELGETNKMTQLKLDLKGMDPDEGVSDIAYEKGYAFLLKIEQTVGREKLDKFLNGYFSGHAFHSIVTEDFLTALNRDLIAGNKTFKDEIDAETWIYKPGTPKNLPQVGSEKFREIDQIITTWTKNRVAAGLRKSIASTTEILYFLRHLPEEFFDGDMAALDNEFNLTNSGNSEIQCVWYTLAVRHKYHVADNNLENFLVNVGRRKFLMPIYKELAKSPEGKKRAQVIYAEARPNYHSVAFNSIDEVLK